MKIYQNSILAQTQNQESAEIKLINNSLSINVYDKNYEYNEETGEKILKGENLIATATLDVLSSIYSSQLFIKQEDSQEGQFVHIHRYTHSARSSVNIFHDLLLNPQANCYFQVDIGYDENMEDKLIIKTLRIPIEHISFEGFANIEQVLTDEQIIPTRYEVWDTYSLTCNKQEIGCKNTGEAVFGEPLVVSAADGEYVEFTVKKYSPEFEKKLNRASDCEEVFIETTAGLLNTLRVRLSSGEGKFRLYLLGYKGEIKIKLGWKYFTGWCEYLVIVR